MMKLHNMVSQSDNLTKKQSLNHQIKLRGLYDCAVLAAAEK
jgi:hypothetical protein